MNSSNPCPTGLSPLWQCLCTRFYDFLQAYPDQYESKCGFLKPAVEKVVNKYLDCGDLSKGFARLHCDTCKKDYLLAFLLPFEVKTS